MRSVRGLDFLALSALCAEGEGGISPGIGVTGVRGAEPRAMGHNTQGGRKEALRGKHIHSSEAAREAFTSMGAKCFWGVCGGGSAARS